MATAEKQSELERYYAIASATIDYLISIHAGNFVVDDYDMAVDCYKDVKLTIEKYFKGRRLDRLQQKFASFTKTIQPVAYTDFSIYVKEKTGYDINLFDDLRKRVDAVLLQNEILNKKESGDVATMLTYFDENSISGEKVEKLRSLLGDYCEIELKKPKKRNVHSEVISIKEKDGIELITEKITFTTGPKPKHDKEFEFVSPDGKRKIIVSQWSDGKQASTFVSLQFFSGASGGIYGVKGICKDLKVSWKDNSTILIETNKDYEVNMQHKKVRSLDNTINIEYIER